MNHNIGNEGLFSDSHTELKNISDVDKEHQELAKKILAAKYVFIPLTSEDIKNPYITRDKSFLWRKVMVMLSEKDIIDVINETGTINIFPYYVKVLRAEVQIAIVNDKPYSANKDRVFGILTPLNIKTSGFKKVGKSKVGTGNESLDKSWIAVDLDATLAKYTKWEGIEHIGEPVPIMLDRVKAWIADGKTVKIFTARVEDKKAIPYIEEWLKENDIGGLEITNIKDMHMVELWDDRAIAVRPNTGVEIRENAEGDDRNIYWDKLTLSERRDFVENTDLSIDTSQKAFDDLTDKEIKTINSAVSDAIGNWYTICAVEDLSNCLLGNEGLLGMSKEDKLTEFLSDHGYVYYPVSKRQYVNSPYDLMIDSYNLDRMHVKYKNIVGTEQERVAYNGQSEMFCSIKGLLVAIDDFGLKNRYVGYIKIPIEKFKIDVPRFGSIKLIEQYDLVLGVLSARVLLDKSDVIKFGKSGLESYIDLTDKPTYICRYVLNPQDIITWAKEQGFNSVIAPEDMHVTIAYSNKAFNATLAKPTSDQINVTGGERIVLYLGNDSDTPVIKFECKELADRWKEYCNLGASWDYDTYEKANPHISISYNAKKPDRVIIPYTGKIILGPEVISDINPSAKDDTNEIATENKKPVFLSNKISNLVAVGKTNKVIILLTEEEKDLAEYKIKQASKIFPATSLSDACNWVEKSSNRKKYKYYMVVSIRDITGGYAGGGVIAANAVKVKHVNKLPKGNVMSNESFCYDLALIGQVEPGLEGFAILDKISSGLAMAKGHISKLFKGNALAGGVIPVSYDLVAVSQKLSGKGHTDLMHIPVFVPEGVSAPMVKYLSEISVVLDKLNGIENRLIKPLTEWSGYMLSIPDYADKSWFSTALKPVDISLYLSDLKKCYSGSQSDALEQSTYTKVYPGGSDDMKYCYDAIIRLTSKGNSIMAENLLDKIDALYKQINMVVNDDTLSVKLPFVEKNKMINVVNLCYQLAAEVEMLSVLLFQIKVASVAHSRTIEKIKSL